MKSKSMDALWVPLILFCFLFPALASLSSGSALPCTHDNSLHYYRITAMREAFRHGWWFSRWVPNLALGYGYPFFNFREPLPYLLGTLLYALGISLPVVLELLYTASFVAAGWGAYILARDLFGARAAWVTAVAYSLGPYMLLDALRRGNLPESVALALLPWLMVIFRRVILGRGRESFIAAVLLLLALFLSHNISSLLFAPLLGGYVVALSWTHRHRKAWPWAFVAVVVAVGLTAWFWLPALMEQSTVQLHLSRTTRNNDFHYNFATWREILFTPPVPYDADFLNPPMRISLGFVQWILALIGLGVGLWRARRRELRVLLIFFAFIALAYLWMSTPASLEVWEAFSLLAFVQFPWRLVGRALLPVALLGGAAFVGDGWRPSICWPSPLNDKSRFTLHASRFMPHILYLAPHITLLTTLLLLALFAYPDIYPPKGYCSVEAYPDMAGVYAYERQGRIGVDPEGSYFPIWVEQHPTDTALADAFVRGEEPLRLDATVLPEGASVQRAVYRPLRASLTVQTPAAFQARWLGFYYPGWQVRVDGVPVEAAPEAETGLLTFPIEAGEHEITVRFGSTPLRRVASWTSLVTLGVFGILVWRIRITDQQDEVTESVHPLPTLLLRVLAGGAMGLLLFKAAILEQVPNPVRRSRLASGEVPEVSTAVQQPFKGGITLIGYSQASGALPADGELQVDLLWQARDIPPVEYRTSVLLMGADDQVWSYAGTLRPRGYEPASPTTMWLPGNYVYDPHIVTLLPGTPPGAYRVVVALFDKVTLQPASVLGADGNPIAPTFTLGTVRVLRPQTVPDRVTLGVPADAVLWRCGALGLLAMEADRARAAPGELVAVRWVWEATLPGGLLASKEPLTATLTLRDASGMARRMWVFPPSTSWWPTDRWAGGERWVGRHIVHLPANLESGVYQFEASLVACADFPLGTVSLDVTAPERVWTLPADVTPASVVFGGQIRLAGYALEPASLSAGASLRVRLVWQAVAEMAESYRVFVHLTGPEHRVFAQSDGEPAAWMRPTTGWAVGEVISETRELAVPVDAPAGAYHVRIGLYLLNGPPMQTEEGEDAFVLGPFTLP